MNIKILDSWLKEYLRTDATPKQIAEKLSLTSVSIERIEKWKDDFLYDIEVTTNRPDLASVVGLAREAGAVLPQAGIDAKFLPPHLTKPTSSSKESITIESNPALINRICAVILEVDLKPSPEKIKERLESSDIRSLNNIIDVTNYVMRAIGHPSHVFDYDRLTSKKLIIRESKKGEKITTLDDRTYTLTGSDIVADDGEGNTIDLLGVMGLKNSVVTDETKRILFFINNNEPHHIRRTSMGLGIRTEAAQLNEKSLDPERAMEALLFGIDLYKEIAGGKVLSEIYDIYPNKKTAQPISVSLQKVNEVIGVTIPEKTSLKILTDLGFKTEIKKDTISVIPPSYRVEDIQIPEDIIEEIARVYGYHTIPSILPAVQPDEVRSLDEDEFYWEDRIRKALKYWGLTEVYSYPMVSEVMYEGPVKDAVTLANPLGEEFVYMRSSLIPSLLKIAEENKRFQKVAIFEIANVYEKMNKKLPLQKIHLAGLIKDKKVSFFQVKGIIEQLTSDLGIPSIDCKTVAHAEYETAVFIGKDHLGTVEVLDDGLINFELDFSVLLKHASTKKTFKPLSKFPPVIEDLAFIVEGDITTGEIIQTIQKVDHQIAEVSLLDKYQDTRTFHIHYQNPKNNMTNEDVTKIREKITQELKKKYNISLK